MSCLLQTAFSRQQDSGARDSVQYAALGLDGPISCVNGTAIAIPGDANNTFRCDKVSTEPLLIFNNSSSLTCTDRPVPLPQPCRAR